ncbi:major tail protein [Staphylococcus pseudoxylosus]|uniref:major tail protein n=1 Tax=Staphylococcus pseudoxylosus TaxID=2282419 RepID=UPI002DBB187E|nr:major tail protein [Staphylococcus pseudoxylosus]MEB5784160.1 phage tail protein [Staphylococcus pseudoxylosus]
MAVVGFEKVHVGIFDEDEKIKKLMTWKDEHGGTVNLNISGLAPEKVEMRASNKTVWSKKQGTGEVQSELDVFNVPDKDLDAVLGRDMDDNGTSWVGEKTRAPYVALIGESEDLLSGEPVYLALTKGTMSLESIEWKTTPKEAEEPEPQQLTGDWIARTINDESRTYGYHVGKEGSDELFQSVFPGYENVGEGEMPDNDNSNDNEEVETP